MTILESTGWCQSQANKYCKSTNFGGYKIWRFSNKVIRRLLNLASPRGPSMQCTIDVYVGGQRQILAKTRNSPNSPNIIARQNLLIYSIWIHSFLAIFFLCFHSKDYRKGCWDFFVLFSYFHRWSKWQ